MKQLKKSDLPLLQSIKEKQGHMNRIQRLFSIGCSEPPDDPSQLGYALMEQLDTLNQIKGLESSICNDKQNDQ